MSEETVPYEGESTYEEMVYYRGRVTTLTAEVSKLRQRAEATETTLATARKDIETLTVSLETIKGQRNRAKARVDELELSLTAIPRDAIRLLCNAVVLDTEARINAWDMVTRWVGNFPRV